MAKNNVWLNKNVNLKSLADGICDFLRNDDFTEVELTKGNDGSWYSIQARKKGVKTTMIGRRKAFRIMIEGNPMKFTVSIKGEMGKNFATGGLIGVGVNVKYQNKLWAFIQKSVDILENSSQNSGPAPTYKTPNIPKQNTEHKSKTMVDEQLHRSYVQNEQEDPFSILQTRLAKGEIRKKEFHDLVDILKSTLRDNVDSVTIKHDSETRFWTCPNCDGILEDRDGKQYCSKCKDFL